MRSFLFVPAIIAGVMMAPAAKANVCADITTCTFTFSANNGFGGLPASGTFGTVNLSLTGSDIVFNIDLDDAFGFRMIQTGIADGSFGFNQSAATTALTYSNFTSTTQSSNASHYSGPGGPDLSFSAFGDFDHSIRGPGPSKNGGSGANQLSFTVSKAGGFTDVNQLVSLSAGGGQGPAYFVADVIRTSGCTVNGCTGLIAVTGPRANNVVPEPISSALVGTGLLSLFFLRRRQTP